MSYSRFVLLGKGFSQKFWFRKMPPTVQKDPKVGARPLPVAAWDTESAKHQALGHPWQDILNLPHLQCVHRNPQPSLAAGNVSGMDGRRNGNLLGGRIRTPLLAVWKVGPLITMTTRTFHLDSA